MSGLNEENKDLIDSEQLSAISEDRKDRDAKGKTKKHVKIITESGIWTEGGLLEDKKYPIDEELVKEEGEKDLEYGNGKKNDIRESAVLLRQVTNEEVGMVKATNYSPHKGEIEPTSEDRENMMKIGAKLPDVNYKEVEPFNELKPHPKERTAPSNSTSERRVGQAATNHRERQDRANNDQMEIVNGGDTTNSNQNPGSDPQSAAGNLQKSTTITQTRTKVMARFHIVGKFDIAKENLL